MPSCHIRFFLFVFIFLILSVQLSALSLAPAQLEIYLDQNQKNILYDFSLSLQKEDYEEEAKFYKYVAQETITTNVAILKKGDSFFVIAPASLVSLSNNYKLLLTGSGDEKTVTTKLSIKHQGDLFWIFEVENLPIMQSLYFISIQDITEDSTSWLFNLTILTAPKNLDFFTPSEVTRRYDLSGAIVLNKDLQPIGVLTYTNAQTTVISLKIVGRILEKILPRQELTTPTLGNLTLAAEDFAQAISKDNILTATTFFSTELVYRFGHAAYLFLRSSAKTQNLVSRNDIRRGGLFPLRQALGIFFYENMQKTQDAFRFRIVVSLADNLKINSSIVTFSLNRTIVSTAWRWYNEGWAMDGLPLVIENPLVPFVVLGKQEVLTPPLKPFSGMVFSLGASFYPKYLKSSSYMGYNLNLSKYLSVDFKLSYDVLLYENSYDTAPTGHFAGQIFADFLGAKVGLRLQYPFPVVNKIYLMPYFGIELGSAFLLHSTESTHSYFDNLLIRRVPVTLLVGWSTGFEFGFRVGIPMAVGIGVSYQQDFFGHQTIKNGPPSATNVRGNAEMYYLSLYYKFAVPV